MTWVGVVPALSWAAALPGLVLAACILWLPGALLARRAGARGLMLVATAPLLTCGLLAVLVLVHSVLLAGDVGLTPWLQLALLVVLALLGALVVRLLGGWRTVPDRSPTARPRGRRLDALPVVLAALVTGASFMGATGAAGTVEQSNDSPFHLLAIQRVVSSGDISWQQVRRTTGDEGFYPPLFHDLAALLTGLLHPLGVDVVAASSILLLLLVAVVWPLGIDALVRTILTAGGRPVPRWRPDRVARAAAMAFVVAVPLFPAQLVQFGALWPNLLGLVLAPVVLAALVDVAFPSGRAGERASLWTPALGGTVLVLGLPALVLAHPGAFLSTLVAAAGLLLTIAGRVLRRLWTGWRAGGPVVRVGGALVAAVAAVAALGVGYLLLRRAVLLTRFTTTHVWSLPDALRRVASLDVVRGTHTGPVAVVGLLALAGVVGCLVDRQHRWLVAGWALTALQVVLAGAVDGPLTALLTGLWYHETARLSSALALTALPLAALGAVVVVAALSRLGAAGARRATSAVVAAAALALVVVGVGDVHRVLRDTYQGMGAGRTLVTPAEAALYARTLRPAGAAAGAVVPSPGGGSSPEPAPAVLGDPFGGAMFAGLYSGRPLTIAHFGEYLKGPADSTSGRTRLVAKSFRTFASDPQVCAAVKALRIGYAVEDTARIWHDDARFSWYSGLRGLDGVPGLQLVAREGTVSVYRLTTCTASTVR